MRMLNPSGARKGKKGHLLCWGWGGAATPTRAEARAACGGRSPVATELTLHLHTITGSREERASVVGAVPECYLCGHRTAGASTL